MKKLVKESLNENFGSDNKEVATEILANKTIFQEEFSRNVYFGIIAIAKEVNQGVPFEIAFNEYVELRGWFEEMNQKASKRKYFEFLGILEELGFDIGEKLENILNSKDELMRESLNENFESDNPQVQQFIEENGLEDGTIASIEMQYDFDRTFWRPIKSRIGYFYWFTTDGGVYDPGNLEAMVDD